MKEFRAWWMPALLALMMSPLFARAQSAAAPNLSKQPTLYVVGYAHLDTEWRWEYPQVIDEYLRRTMDDNFRLIDKYPHYIFNFSGANRYRMMKEYYPADFARVKQYVAQGRWFPAGSSMEEGDVNAPSAEGIFRQVLYGNDWFRREFGVASEEFMLPDCFGFPSSLPTILAASGVKGFSTQKLTWGSSADAGGPESIENTPEGTPFNVGVWVGPDGESVMAGLNPGSYSGDITTDLSQPLPPLPPNPEVATVQKQLGEVLQRLEAADRAGRDYNGKDLAQYYKLRSQLSILHSTQTHNENEWFQGDWAGRVLNNGKATGVFTDYHYYGTGDIGGAPKEESVKRLEAIVTKGSVDLPPADLFFSGGEASSKQPVPVGRGPVHVISGTADQMFRDITPAQESLLPRYTGEMELTNHSAGSLTSQAYQKRWIRKEELLASAAEESSVAAAWLGARSYPIDRLNGAWTLAMGAHFHDLAAGTATPRAYEFAWNDDVIAMNQFAGVLKSATEGVTAGLNTQTHGIPVVVFNPLNIARQDIVEASIDFPNGAPKAVYVVAPDGKQSPAQIANGKVIFEASVPSVGYAVYSVEPGAVAGASELRVTGNDLENAHYRVRLNQDGDVASIFDKDIGRELLSAPARLAISYDNPKQWPAWNMDWDQEQAPPKSYVSGPAKIRVVENGPVRVAIEVARETAGSRFVQTIRLAAGDAGRRVEFGNVIDWSTRESNLKATFPLTASNEMATYNWDVGTIERPTAQPNKFEVPSHQWIDLTDMSGTYGATILTDCKNGSDKPNDHTIRLTLIRTPGTSGGYPDQATQDIGHHEFVYGIAGHADGWRAAQTDWQAERLNAPLIAFESPKHSGALGHSFSLVRVNNPRIRIMALKRAEESDELVLRMVELDGKPQQDVQVSFASPVVSAREVNGQEQPIGPATVKDGALVTSFGAYQPRTFALKLRPAPATVSAVRSTPVNLHYDLAAATNDGDASTDGFDGKGDALPAEMLPAQIAYHGVTFKLAPAKTGSPDAIVAQGQTIRLPEGDYNRVYLLAASDDGDRKAAFEVGGHKTELNIEDWGGFIGQWDDRVWSSPDAVHDHYGEMIGLKPGFIKRADLAWYSDHHHDAKGKNVAYSYSYLFGYAIDLPAGARTLKLPVDNGIRILAVSVAEENPYVKPVQPLYDVLPPSDAGSPDFTITAASSLSIPQGRSAVTSVFVMPRGNFNGAVALAASGLPAGVTATFEPATTKGFSKMTVTADGAAAPATVNITLTGTAGEVSHSATETVAVTPVLKDTLPVNLSSAYNVNAIYADGVKFAGANSLDSDGSSFSAQTLGRDQVGDEVVFHLGPPNAPDAVSSKTVDLPEGRYRSVTLLAAAVDGNQPAQTFVVNYTSGNPSTFSQSLHDWSSSRNYQGESIAAELPYRATADGGQDSGPFYARAYSFALDSSRTVHSISLPANRNVVVLAVTLVPAAK
ncbi:MAG: glycoside hydrolase family 38 C-terminal domain-containing protein [Terracidiphilus sp.]